MKKIAVLLLLLACSSLPYAEDRKEAMAELKKLRRPITTEGFKETCKVFQVGFTFKTNSDESRVPGEQQLSNLMSLYFDVGEKGWTPNECLVEFLNSGMSDAYIVDFLLSSGANPNYKRIDSSGNKQLRSTPVIYMIFGKLHFTGNSLEHSVRSAKILMEKGANINEPDYSFLNGKSYAITSLMDALQFHKQYRNAKEYQMLSDFAVYLVKHGADINAGIDSTRTALATVLMAEPYSPENTDVELVKLLVANGANVNAHVWYGGPVTGSKGGSLLYYAKEKGLAEIVDILKENGAKEVAPVKGSNKSSKKKGK